MTFLVRSTSLIRGKVNETTKDVYASPSKPRKRTVSLLASSAASTARTLSSSLSSRVDDVDDDVLIKKDDSQEPPQLLGHEAHLFAPQQERKGVLEMLQQLSSQEREQLTDPQMLIRYYRASKGHVLTAMQQLRQTLQWRTEFGVDALCHCTLQPSTTPLADILANENASGKIYVRGYDDQGRALVYMRPARENTHNEHDQMRHLVWNLEKAIACTRRESRVRSHGKQELEKIILLIDYEGFAVANAPPMSTTKATLHILQNMYPERMYRAYCLHPPFIFRAFWNMVRPFVDPVTKEKIVFVSSTKTQQQLWSLMNDRDLDLETGAGGKLSPNDFDSTTYLQLPFDQAFPTRMTTMRKERIEM